MALTPQQAVILGTLPVPYPAGQEKAVPTDLARVEVKGTEKAIVR
jgi:hypothetical protein